MRATGPVLDRQFAEMARLEKASVDAFRHLQRELVAHGAPRRLVRAAERAERDEVRYGQATGALANRHSCQPTLPRVAPHPLRDLEAIATENAVEGCVREAFGALVASWQARASADPEIQAAMKRIARDETRHAALALQVDGWLKGRLDTAARARVEQARRQALHDLASRSSSSPLALVAPLGLPTAAQARLLALQMIRLAA
jgi:hypothetical protein